MQTSRRSKPFLPAQVRRTRKVFVVLSIIIPKLSKFPRLQKFAAVSGEILEPRLFHYFSQAPLGLCRPPPSGYCVNATTNIPDVGTTECTNAGTGFSSRWRARLFQFGLGPMDSDPGSSLLAPDETSAPPPQVTEGDPTLAVSLFAMRPVETTFEDNGGTSNVAGSPPTVGTVWALAMITTSLTTWLLPVEQA